jgi:hypothetical protein
MWVIPFRDAPNPLHLLRIELKSGTLVILVLVDQMRNAKREMALVLAFACQNILEILTLAANRNAS